MPTSNQDHWTSAKYQSAASFVPQLTTTVLSYLDIQPTDRILDIGCGDGQLTSKIAQAAPEGQVLGLDASHSFIATANQSHSSPNCSYRLQDCTALSASSSDAVGEGSWDKVFSNAALHWILRPPGTRTNVFHEIHRALRPGGFFVFEMGGKGNVAEIHAAFTAALLHAGGLSIHEAREACPWFFPSVEWMRKTLEGAGFELVKCESEYRPTKLNPETADGSGGIEGWLRLMGARFLEAVDGGKREGVLKEVCDVLESVITREEDGSRWIGYVRLRAVARKK
ncbi:S-adenosyl-L-methionine-dependent methyltransferase [Hortaea werneckii]|nr:S-adenosyl-L-methionine-dependent methyltransferase [Hortaea werneckii]